MGGVLRSRWEQWSTRFAAMSRRERGLMALAALALIAFVGSTVFVEPRRAKLKMLQNSVEKKRQETRNLETQFAAYQAQLRQDPNASVKAELERWRAQLRRTGEELNQANEALVPPAEMNTLLERILVRQPGLRLVSLRTLPPASFIERPAGSGTAAPAGKDKPAETPRDFDIYRHGVEVKLNGSFPELYAYLVQLEQERKKLLWDEVRLKVIDYPKAELTLVVYTLSVDKTWLAL